MLGWLYAFTSNFAGELGAKTISEFLTKTGAEVAKEKILRVVKTDKRAELMSTLLFMDESEIQGFWDKYQKIKFTPHENEVATHIAEALPRKSDGSIDYDKAEKMIKHIAEMGEDRFADLIELAKHDPIMQHARYAIRKVREAGGKAAELAQEVVLLIWDYTDEHAAQIAQRLEPRVEEFSQGVRDLTQTSIADRQAIEQRRNKRWRLY